ncbi:MAG: serine/threonine-protein kinase [Corynebacterium sp.]|uniref:serine/threonine-protein kinase n=1 Tax=Corynebacterium sp. TaxID=1720 RepID=UPI0026DF74D8|nr:serine/threonine-protein kinase [Corynebacterium sp.]MDO5669654.1 serine/threonine-protein kinase [Corynebacterium sp.]
MAEFFEVLRERHDFTDIEEIGRGGMGVVYRARDPKLDRRVAIKLLSTELLDAAASLARFESEMRTLAKIKHSAVVTIHSADTLDDDRAYFVMDYIDGDDLASLIRTRREWGNRFTIEETVELLRPIAAALDHLHLRMQPAVIHRDVKPGNILVPRRGNTEVRSLLTDFGISLAADDTRITSLSVMIGTERYYAPELFPGGTHGAQGTVHNTPTAASDNYALTLIAFEMLTLASYKDTMSVDEWANPDRPLPHLRELGIHQADQGNLEGVEKVLRKALAPAPAYRYQTAVEFIQALSQAGGSRSIDRPPAPAPQSETYAPTMIAPPLPPAPQRGSSTGLISLLLVLILLLGGVLGGVAWFMRAYPSWENEEAPIVSAFPQLVPRFQNLSGWDGLSCAAGSREEGQRGAVTCSDAERTLHIVDYGSGSQRDEALTPHEATHWLYNNCEIASWPAGDARHAIVPTNTAHRFALFYSGPNAADTTTQIPVC